VNRLRDRGPGRNSNGNSCKRFVTATETVTATGTGDQIGSDRERFRPGTGPGYSRQDLSRYYTQSGKKPDYSTESGAATADSRQQPDQKPGISDRKRKTTGGLGKRNSFPHRGYVVYM
jgi:hypothetical protein